MDITLQLMGETTEEKLRSANILYAIFIIVMVCVGLCVALRILQECKKPRMARTVTEMNMEEIFIEESAVPGAEERRRIGHRKRRHRRERKHSKSRKIKMHRSVKLSIITEEDENMGSEKGSVVSCASPRSNPLNSSIEKNRRAEAINIEKHFI
ncbi:hypothetical protein ENBRE01_2604 [Enteropsectra breve]|nr:hypothetical protein ENBRE01_2493 [Enteropsectra breve]KAI5152147.1 hypothetical protein ENBRE01_2604 [Enteropsectra breve]